MRTPEPVSTRYILQDELGAGNMGVVYRAIDRLTGRMVALKRVVIDPGQLRVGTTSEETNPTLALAREFRVLASLRHPHIIDVLDYGWSANQTPFFTMRLLQQPLDLSSTCQGQPLRRRLAYVLQLLQALVYLHRRGLIHRDLKPGNILIDQHDILRVLDFGLAMKPEQAREAAGTLAYMPPEILRGQMATQASDLYAVGIIAHELICQAHPFDVTDTQALIVSILQHMPDPVMLEQRIREQDETIDAPALSALIQRLMLKNPQDRYQSASDVMTGLCRALSLPVPPDTDSIREGFLQAADFVGREAELNQLRTALGQVQASQGSAWLIGGESGVGKSRLADELRIHALVEGLQVLHGQNFEQMNTPLQMWQSPLRQLILNTELAEDEAHLLKHFLPDVERLLGYAVPDGARDDPAQMLAKLGDLIGDLLSRQRSPAVLILEDLQWADDLDILRQVTRRITTLPVLIVGTFRDDEQPDLPSRLADMHLMTLPKLPPSAIQQLAIAMLGEAGRMAMIHEFLQVHTQGNVFFLVEAVRALSESVDHLSDIASVTLPPSLLSGGIQAVIERRLQRVSASALEGLKLAAVAGRELDIVVLKHAMHNSERIDLNAEDWLTHCSALSILDVYEDRWRFVHDKLRETVLSMIDEASLPSLHYVIAQAIEATHPDDPSQAVALATHWRSAGQPTRELPYLILVIEQTLAVGESRRALSLAQRAISLVTESSSVQLHVQLLLATALFNLGDNEAADEAYGRAIGLAEALSDETQLMRALNGAGFAEAFLGQRDAARARFECTLELAERLQDGRQLAEARRGLGNIAFEQGQMHDAYERYRQALEKYREIGWRYGYARCLTNLANSERHLQMHEEALSHHQEAMAIFESLSDRAGVARCLNNIGNVHLYLADYVKCEEYYLEGLRLQLALGNEEGAGLLYINLGYVNEIQGFYEQSLIYYQEALMIYRRHRLPRLQMNSLNNMGVVYAMLGRYAEADAVYREADDLPIKDDRALAMLYNNRGRLAVLKGNYDEAEGHFKASIHLKEGVRDASGLVYSWYDFAYLEVLRSNLDEARQHLIRLAESPATYKMPAVLVEVCIALAAYYVAMGQDEQAYALTRQLVGDSALHTFMRQSRLEPLLEKLEARWPVANRAAIHAQPSHEARRAALQTFLLEHGNPSSAADLS